MGEEKQLGLADIFQRLSQRVGELEEETGELRRKLHNTLDRDDIDKVAEQVEQRIAQKIQAQLQQR